MTSDTGNNQTSSIRWLDVRNSEDFVNEDHADLKLVSFRKAFNRASTSQVNRAKTQSDEVDLDGDSAKSSSARRTKSRRTQKRKKSTAPGASRTSVRSTNAGPAEQSSATGELAHSMIARQYKHGFLSILHTYYYPASQKDIARQDQYPRWITAACDVAIANPSENLRDTLLANALAIVSQKDDRKDLFTTAMQHYMRAVRNLMSRISMLFSQTIAAVAQEQLDVILIMTQSCAMFEAVAHQDFASSMKHMQGVGAMIRARGSKNLHSKISRRTFQEHRATMMTIDLATRRGSWLSEPEWLNPEWKASDPNSADILQQVIDIALLLPPIMERFDRTKAALEGRSSGSDDDSDYRTLRKVLRQALRVETMMVEYEHKLKISEGDRGLYIPRPSTSKTDHGTIYPITYTFHNYDLASALAYVEMIKICLYNFLTEVTAYTAANFNADSNHSSIPVTNSPSPPSAFIPLEGNHTHNPLGSSLAPPPPLTTQASIKTYSQKATTSADRVCMSLDYFLEEHRRIITRMVILAPFQSAMGVFKRHVQEGTGNEWLDRQVKEKERFCEMVLGRSKELDLPVWISG